MMESTNIPKLFVLPKDTSPDSRILTLGHPKTAAPCRFLFCPEKGIYEFTKVAAPKAATRSLLITRPVHGAADTGRHVDTGDSTTSPKVRKDGDDKEVTGSVGEGTEKVEEGQLDVSKGYIARSSDLFIATRMDPLFLLLPALQPPPRSEASTGQKKHLFLSADDHFDSITSSSKHFAHVLRNPAFRETMESRMDAVCDTVEAGDDKMYRLSMEKLVAELVYKAMNMIADGLPASLEERFVTRALEVPFAAVTGEESCAPETTPSVVDERGVNGSIPNGEASLSNSTSSSEASLSRTTSLASSEASQATAATSITEPLTDLPAASSSSPPPPLSATEEITRLLRLRTALTYLTTNYLPDLLRAQLTLFTSPSPSSLPSFTSAQPVRCPIDFTPLDKHLSHLSGLRDEALKAQSLFSIASRKRSSFEDEGDDAVHGSDKKRVREDEEEKKRKEKVNSSRALRDLKKTDTSGMKKLSSFFGGGGSGSGKGGGKNVRKK